jgi:hypothetical protein
MSSVEGFRRHLSHGMIWYANRYPDRRHRPDTRLLEAIVAARSSAQKHVWRARIVLLTVQGLDTQAIMGATGKYKTCV